MVSCLRIRSWADVKTSWYCPRRRSRRGPTVAGAPHGGHARLGLPVQSSAAPTPSPWVSSCSAAPDPSRRGVDGPSRRRKLLGEPAPLAARSTAITRAHGAAELRRAGARRPLAETASVSRRRRRAASRRRTRCRCRHEMAAPSSKESSSGSGTSVPRRHLHEGRVGAVAGHAVDDDALAAELGQPTRSACTAAAPVMVVHDALADPSPPSR